MKHLTPSKLQLALRNLGSNVQLTVLVMMYSIIVKSKRNSTCSDNISFIDAFPPFRIPGLPTSFVNHLQRYTNLRLERFLLK